MIAYRLEGLLAAAFKGRADIEGLEWQGGVFRCLVGGRTPVSLFPAAASTRFAVSSDTIDGCAVRLEAAL